MVLRWWVWPLLLPYKQVLPMLICVAQWRKCFGWKSFEKFLCSPRKVSGEFPWTQNTTVSFRFGTKGAQDLYFWCILGSLFCGACSFKLGYFVNLWSGGVWIMLYKKIVCQCIWVICYNYACKGYVGKMRGCVDWQWCDALQWVLWGSLAIILVLKPATLTLSAPSCAELAGRISLACWFCNSSYTCLLSCKIRF